MPGNKAIVMSVLFVVILTAQLIATGDTNNTCYNRFEYEYHVLEKLVNLEQERARMNETIASLLRTNSLLISTVKGHVQTIDSMKETLTTLVRVNGPSGTSYIRWGRTSCPTDAGAELVYDGYAAGGYFSHVGGSTKYLCLPRDPDFLPISGGSMNLLYGTEYETGGAGSLNDLQDHDVPCAVCRTPRVSVIMIPGRNHCHDGWVKEYNGYLMGEYYAHSGPKENVCVDQDAEHTDGGSPNHNGALMYLTQVRCGSLKCPPYEDRQDLTCVVCSYIGTP